MATFSLMVLTGVFIFLSFAFGAIGLGISILFFIAEPDLLGFMMFVISGSLFFVSLFFTIFAFRPALQRKELMDHVAPPQSL